MRGFHHFYTVGMCCAWHMQRCCIGRQQVDMSMRRGGLGGWGTSRKRLGRWGIILTLLQCCTFILGVSKVQ